MRLVISLVVGLMLAISAFAGPGRSALASRREDAADTLIKVEVEGRGDFVIKLNLAKAPRTAGHILKLVRAGFYDGQRYHRVERSPKPFLVQVGDPASKTGDLTGNGGSNEPIGFEDSGLPNVLGAVGLGHPLDQPDKGDSQFFVLLDNATFLNGKYAVFGIVTEGMDVVKKIQKGDRISRISVVGN